jgi:hypothetical protein
MSYLNGVLQFLGDYGRDGNPVAKTTVKGAASLAALDTLAAAITAASPTGFIDAVTDQVTFIETDNKGASRPGTDVDIDEKVVLVVKDTADGSIHKHSLPGPRAEIFDLEGAGKRVKATYLSTWATILGACTGNSYVGLYGYKIEKK